MRKALLRAAIAMAAIIGMVAGASPAWASHLYTIYTTDAVGYLYIRCMYLNDSGWYDSTIYPGGSSPLNCRDFSVGHYRRIKYQSLATGNYYWTACGEDLPGLNPDFGWASVGNNVRAVAKAAYPTAPANVCVP